MVKYPLASRRDEGRCDRQKRLCPVVPVELHLIWRPHHAVCVVARIIDLTTIRKDEARADSAPTGITRPVIGGGSGGSRILWDPFHDVGLAAVRPAYGANVRSQHPKRRPQAVTNGQFYSGFDAAILKLLQTLRFHPCGRPRSTRRSHGTYDQIAAAIHENVWRGGIARRGIGSCGTVDLQFRIAPATASHVVSPIRGVRERAGRTVEFVTP